MKRIRKYANSKVKADGHTFDSKAEYQRYLYLKNRLELKEITDLTLQPIFQLSPGFKISKNTTIRGYSSKPPTYYIADFQYKEDGKTIIEDVKGFKTPVYRLKMKFFLPTLKENVKFIEVMIRRTKRVAFKEEVYEIYVGK